MLTVLLNGTLLLNYVISTNSSTKYETKWGEYLTETCRHVINAQKHV